MNTSQGAQVDTTASALISTKQFCTEMPLSQVSDLARHSLSMYTCKHNHKCQRNHSMMMVYPYFATPDGRDATMNRCQNAMMTLVLKCLKQEKVTEAGRVLHKLENLQMPTLSQVTTNSQTLSPLSSYRACSCSDWT